MDELAEKLLDDVQRFIDLAVPIDRSKPVVVGLSGGADSVALLDILHRLGYRCIAAHCNFGLRGEESQRDAAFACGRAAMWQVPFCRVDFDTQAYVAENKVSVEMACRTLRYDWFERVRLEYRAGCIAVAHHGDDSIETFFLNLIRGTGIAGLVGIRPVNGHVVRPLLCTNRQTVLGYLDACGLPYVTDSTNLEDVYMRNKIRLHVLPLLNSIRPGVPEAVLRSIGNLQEAERVYNEATRMQLRGMLDYKKGACFLNIERLLQSASPVSYLFEWLNPHGFAPTVCREILRSLNTPDSGKLFFAAGYRLIRDRADLILTAVPEGNRETDCYRIEKGEVSPLLPIRLSVSYLTRNDRFEMPRTPEYACFDVDKLQFPLTLRRWRPGDRFKPFGMKGYKKLSDYFSDRKYSILQKEQAWILCSGDEIVWLVGERGGDLPKVDDSTRSILLLKFE